MCAVVMGMGRTNDEHPAPAGKIAEAVHVDDTVPENARDSRRQATNGKEHGVPLLQLVSSIPCREEIDATGEVSCFQDTKNHTKTKHLVPSLDETKALGWVRRL